MCAVLRMEYIFNMYSYIISIAVLTKSKDIHSILQETKTVFWQIMGNILILQYNKEFVNLLEQNINRTRFIVSFWCGDKCMLLAF